MKLRKTDATPLNKEIECAQKLVDDVRKVVRYFEDRRLNPDEVVSVQEIKPIVLQLLQENPYQINMHRAVLELYGLLSDVSENDILEAINSARELYPEDLEITFWSGCLYQKLDKLNEAEAMYEKSSATSNGVILYRLSEMGFPRIASSVEEK